ncbi:unnamed protein product, partial [Staurois parvus]
YNYLLCAVVLHRAAWILLCLGPPQALLAPASYWMLPQQAACYGGTHCSMCPFTHGAKPMRRRRPRTTKTVHITGAQVSIEEDGGTAAQKVFYLHTQNA